jgi:hypothetical protein
MSVLKDVLMVFMGIVKGYVVLDVRVRPPTAVFVLALRKLATIPGPCGPV